VVDVAAAAADADAVAEDVAGGVAEVAAAGGRCPVDKVDTRLKVEPIPERFLQMVEMLRA
jgi:hypothetical protein